MLIPLPIDAFRDELETAWSTRRNFILRAPTGSGKSTRIPRFLLEGGFIPHGQHLLILQPRRMAARLLARRVAHELGEVPGGTVGYQVRFDSVRSEKTRLLFVTEGLLLRKMASPGGLEGVGGILFDEFHERHLEGDLGLGLAVRRQAADWEGRIGVFSATLETGGLRGYLPEAALLETEGRVYPVATSHLGEGERKPPWERAAEGFRKALAEGAEADILIFMPGKREILRTVEALRGLREARGWELCPLYGELDAASQDRAVEPGSGPRVVVATNIAETSLTLPGIRTVIDSGLARQPHFDPRRGVNTLLTGKISRSSAEQRAGRAGRLAPGRCLRLWSRKDHEHRLEQTLPEIRRLDLAEARLQLMSHGGWADFRWLEPPPALAWERAGRLLEDLGAVREGDLTPLGREMARFPLHPRFSRILLAAREGGCLQWVLPAVALLEGRGIILPIGDKRRERERERWWEAAEGVSDLLQGVLAWERVAGEGAVFCREWGIHWGRLRQAERVREQLLRLTGKVEEEVPTVEAFAKSILTGYVDQLGRRLDRGSLRCLLVQGRRGELRRESLVREAPLLVSADMEEREYRGEAVLFLGAVTAVEEAWLADLYPEDLHVRRVERMDVERRRVEEVEVVVFRDLVLREKETGSPDPVRAGEVLAEHIHREGWVLKKWDVACETWIRRVNVLAEACPELEIRPITEEDRLLLTEQICEGAVTYKEVKDREVMPVIRTWLPETLLPLLDEWTPLRFTFPGGGGVKLRYEADGTVILPARIQQLYDVPGKALFICQGRKPLRLEILAPNGRPVQITDDLDGFWERQYPQIRKDLFGRYPKHEWR